MSAPVTTRPWMMAELLILAVLSAASVLTQYVVLDTVPTWFSGSVLGYVFWFALGMGMAVVSAAYRGRSDRSPRLYGAVAARPMALWLLAGTGYVALSAWLPASPFLFERRQLLLTHLAFGVIAALLMAPAVFADHAGGLPRRLLAHPVLAWLGLISYGIFLWHYAIVLRLGSSGAGLSFIPVLLLTLGLSVVCAAASYYLVERPVLRLKHERLRTLFAPGRRAG